VLPRGTPRFAVFIPRSGALLRIEGASLAAVEGVKAHNVLSFVCEGLQLSAQRRLGRFGVERCKAFY